MEAQEHRFVVTEIPTIYTYDFKYESNKTGKDNHCNYLNENSQDIPPPQSIYSLNLFYYF